MQNANYLVTHRRDKTVYGVLTEVSKTDIDLETGKMKERLHAKIKQVLAKAKGGGLPVLVVSNNVRTPRNPEDTTVYVGGPTSVETYKDKIHLLCLRGKMQLGLWVTLTPIDVY